MRGKQSKNVDLNLRERHRKPSRVVRPIAVPRGGLPPANCT
jgi:hypothetical protein